MTIILICIYDSMVVDSSLLQVTMYVCICHSVTDGEIREAVDRGAGSLYEVQCELPVGSCCGRCAEFAGALVEEHLQRIGGCAAKKAA